MGLSFSQSPDPEISEVDDQIAGGPAGVSPSAPNPSDPTLNPASDPDPDQTSPKSRRASATTRRNLAGPVQTCQTEDDNNDDSVDGEDNDDDDAVDLGFEDSVLDLPPDQLAIFQNTIMPMLASPVYLYIGDIDSVFRAAENCVRQERFGLAEARNLVQSVREISARHATTGAPEVAMETVLFTRATNIPANLIDGVSRGVEEVDPRQTLVFMMCVMSVFPKSIWLEKNRRGLMYRFSCDLAFHFYDQIIEVVDFCKRKTDFEGPYETKDFLQHQQLLLDIATWLERDRPVIVFLMMTAGFADVKNRVIGLRDAPRSSFFALFGMDNTVSTLQRLLNTSDVLKASSLVRTGFLNEAEEHQKFLRKVNAGTLPPQLAVRLAHVQAAVFLHSGLLDRALNTAEDGLKKAREEVDRGEMEALLQRVRRAISKAGSQPHRDPGHVDMEWLEGTNVNLTQIGARRQQEARENHHHKPRRSRPRRPSPDSRSQTPSPAPPTQGRQRTRHDSGYPPSRQVRVSVSPDSSSSYSSHRSVSNTRGVVHVTRDCPPTSAMTESRESIPTLDFDDDDDESDDDDEHDYRRLALSYGDLYDTDKDSTGDGEEVGAAFTGDLQRALGDQASPAEESDWYEKSVQAAETGEDEQDLGEGIELSVNQQEFLNKGGRGKQFYPDILTNEGQLEALLMQDPDRFKRCELKIESAHRSIAKILTKHTKFTEILIMGRSKCGRTYMDDEVVVEVLAEPGQNKGLQTAGRTATDEDRQALEHMAFGQVVGYFPSKRVNYADVEHPVLFCTVDELEGHLMKPLCKTVPKIHVLNDTVKRKYPALVKHRIEIKRISPAGDVEHKSYFNMEPAKREQYVFRVAILSWRQQNIYPLGAVLEAHVGGRDYASGLKVLKLQQRVPGLYPPDVVTDTDSILHNTPVVKDGRLDLTSRRVFTIDPPGSRDLDDALSVWKEGPHYVVGVHIADVAMAVKEGSRVDVEARKRAVTFYPLDRKPHPMLPEPLSHNKCSLIEGQERFALSVFYKFNANGKQVSQPVVKKTVIKSAKQLTYQDAQRAIEDDRTAGLSDSLRHTAGLSDSLRHTAGLSDSLRHTAGLSDSLREDIKLLHTIAQQLREDRFHRSMLYVPFEDPRLKDLDNLDDSLDAHALVEELMVLTNGYIAKRLTSRGNKCRDVMILRCHAAPTWQELAEWREKEGSVANLVMQLQGRKVSPDTQLSVEAHRPDALYQRQDVVVQEELWERLRRHLENGDLGEARQLAFMDDVHPLQCLANQHWMELMDRAQYKCSYGLNPPEHSHFDLDLPCYTHFTSPIRRYADLHVHRLLHADLDGRVPGCDPDDVTRLCQHINSATARQKAFGKGCRALKIADSLQSQPLVFRTFVEQVDSEQLTLMVPSLRAVSDRKQELPFSILGVSAQPEVVTDTAQKVDTVTVKWNKRIFNKRQTETYPGNLMNMINSQEREQPPCQHDQKSVLPLVLGLNPDFLCVRVKQEDWAHILTTLADPDSQHALQDPPSPEPRDQRLLDYMTSERGGDIVSLSPCHFSRRFSPGQVLKVQMSAEPRRGVLQPRVDLVHTARNTTVCTRHTEDPVLTLTTFATESTRDRHFQNYEDYRGAWMPLLEMEAAYGAGGSDAAFVVENVVLKMQPGGSSESSQSPRLRGTFTLSSQFCFDRCINIGGESLDSKEKTEEGHDGFLRETKAKDRGFPVDYVCIRYQTQCSARVTSRVTQSALKDAVDKDYTWVGHAGIVGVKSLVPRDKEPDQTRLNRQKPGQTRFNKKGKSRARTTEVETETESGHVKKKQDVEIQFSIELCPSCPRPPDNMLYKDGVTVTMEVLPKSEVDRRAQEYLSRLSDEGNELAQAIAYGESIPELDEDHLVLGQQRASSEYDFTIMSIRENNFRQQRAIETALTNSLALIQGPPGTGKTYTGVKLLYHFCQINRQLEADGKGKKTVLFCGPSNKSVDHVASLLLYKLGELCPRIVRMYSSAIEAKDYPVPRSNMTTSRNMRDLKSDPALQTITLHHLIRQDDRPYAQEISKYEAFFQKCVKDPEKHKLHSEDVKAYRHLLYTAGVEELGNYDVILTTCAVAGNNKLIEGCGGSIFQVIIDECAMSPEPHSLVPIIATKARQVVLIGDHCQLRPIITCQAAADLGLDMSLFERLFKKYPQYTVFLDKQYRMHREICEFPSQMFYAGQLRTVFSYRPDEKPLLFWPSHPDHGVEVPHILVDVRGQEETLSVSTQEGNEKSKSNLLEADKVMEILSFLKFHDVELQCIKVLTQYNAQRHLLDERIKKLAVERAQGFNRYDRHKSKENAPSTVVSSQGNEWEYVIVSTVRSLPSYKIEPRPTIGWCRQNMGFITDRNQVNVALTRCKKGLIIVGNVELLQCDELWGQLVTRYKRLGCYYEAADFPPKQWNKRYPRTRQKISALALQNLKSNF